MLVKNVTITLEEEVARWARVYAAQHDTSVSRLLGEMLRERMEQEQGYERAMAGFLKRRARALKKQGERYPRRGDLHDR